MEIICSSVPKGGNTARFYFEGEAIDVGGLVAPGEFEGKAGQFVLVRNANGERLALAGLGKASDFWPELLRRAAGKAAKAFQEAFCGEFSLILPQAKTATVDALARAATEGVLLAGYSFDKYKTTDGSEPKKGLKLVKVCGSAKGQIEAGVALGRVLAQSANLARSMANEPPNVASPKWVSNQANALASRHKFAFTELDYAALSKEGLGGIRAVSGGSSNEGRLVVLEYAPKGQEKEAPYVVVGKGICFDSGGLDIKPSGQFSDMKFDKSGACAVMGIMAAVAELKLPIRVIGLMSLAENIPSGTAYRPSDVITIAGKTVEIANTDAEGRVVLADALAYAQRFKPKAMIDLATLTGACVIALGDVASGVLGNDQGLIDQSILAGQASGERVWPFPLWPEYIEHVKGEVADLKNLGASGPGGRGMAGVIAGAAFLKSFADPTPWVHFDIAGTANVAKQKDYYSPGATGVGVRLVTELLMALSAGATHRRR